jgi:hypothetical protein
MWEPRPLTPLWAFTACYRDSFTFFFYLYLISLFSLVDCAKTAVLKNTFYMVGQGALGISLCNKELDYMVLMFTLLEEL